VIADVNGTVLSISCLNAHDNNEQGPWKIVVAYSTKNEAFADKMIEFEVTKEILYRSKCTAINILLVFIPRAWFEGIGADNWG